MELSSEPSYFVEMLTAVLQVVMAAALYTTPINLVLLMRFALRQRTPQTRRWKRIAGWVTFGYVTASIVLMPIALAIWAFDTYADTRFVLAAALPALLGAIAWFLGYRRPVIPEEPSGLFGQLS